ncbi:MAG: DMT family transporter [Boseongicola sp.]
MVELASLSRRDELHGHAAMLAFSALVAGSFSLGGRVANDIDPLALTALRFVLASALIGAIGAYWGAFNRDVFRAAWRYAVLGGLMGGYFVLMFTGLKSATPVSMAAVFTLTPLMAAIFAFWILRQFTTRRMAIALVIGAIGAIWVIFRADLAALLSFRVGRGEIIFFFGCAMHALYIPLVPFLNRGEHVLVFTFGTMLGGAVLVGVIGVSRIMATDWGNLPMLVWIVLGYLVIFASGTSIALVQYASFRIKAAKVMAYTYLIPSWVILWEIGLSGSVPTPVLLPGVGLTIVALTILLREDRVA